MTQPAPSLPDSHEPPHEPVLSAGAPHDDADALGYEAADTALLARLWGESQVRFEER